MDAVAAAEERIVNERLRQKLNEVNSAAQSQLSSVQDHVNFALQQAYFKCAYECFDRRKKHEEISNCVEHCSVPVLQAQRWPSFRSSMVICIFWPFLCIPAHTAPSDRTNDKSFSLG